MFYCTNFFESYQFIYFTFSFNSFYTENLNVIHRLEFFNLVVLAKKLAYRPRDKTTKSSSNGYLAQYWARGVMPRQGLMLFRLTVCEVSLIFGLINFILKYIVAILHITTCIDDREMCAIPFGFSVVSVTSYTAFCIDDGFSFLY